MRILIIGSQGMLGQEIKKTFQKEETICWDKNEIDITEKEKTDKKISGLQPDIIINCAAYNAVDKCEENLKIANEINGYAPGNLAKISKSLNIPLVHFSSGYVFDGGKNDGYKEDDEPNPISKYAKSKLLGEQETKKNTDKAYIIRTNLLFGQPALSAAGKKSFIEIMLALAKEKDSIEAVADEISNPTYARDLAATVYELTTKKYPFGIYHLINGGNASWYDFAKEIFKIKNIHIDVKPVLSEKFPRPAKRPKNSSLLNTKFPPLRKWQDALAQYLKTLK